MNKVIPFDKLTSCDLDVDATYEGGIRGNTGDDPINRLVGGGNQGGFRYVGSPRDRTLKLCVLYSELADPDWPDEVRVETGAFIYYGDNKRPGHELHDTQRSERRSGFRHSKPVRPGCLLDHENGSIAS
jgi:hypothetical protein